MTAKTTELSARNLSVRFGGVVAVDDVSFEVAQNEIVGLVGPNGSGKTTLLNALSGVVRAGGRLSVAGNEITLGHPVQARRAKLIRVFQSPQLCPELSCLDNVMLGADDTNGRSLFAAWFHRSRMWRAETSRMNDALHHLDRVGLAGSEDRSARELTYGEQRLLELARALAAGPRVLMLDEPSAGLNDAETLTLRDLLMQIRQEGTTIIVVDHKIDFIDALCDRVLVLEIGRLIAQGSPAEVWADSRVIDAYLGAAPDA
ncbi:ABC transporter ATP-binding protein [Rhodococcus sp. NPDC019627]|uniref:ABC transporter ATP-binding protein n=1 Tax=unclassified Rhodococcus (in: high G+C Gram-positive bacteria) TaxID=192944 RepID=UPI0033EAF304